MMRDAEKSHSPRVPRKSANNVACAAAEPMEGECGPATHSRDAEPESRVPGAGPHTSSCQQE